MEFLTLIGGPAYVEAAENVGNDTFSAEFLWIAPKLKTELLWKILWLALSLEMLCLSETSERVSKFADLIHLVTLQIYLQAL